MPHVSILIAIVLALLSVGNLIYFIHHIPESINVARIAHHVALELQDSIGTLFPEAVGEAASPPSPAVSAELGPKFRVESQPVRAAQTGYLQVIDDESLLQLAAEHDLVLRLEYRPGDFTQVGSVLLYANPSARVDPRTTEELASCFAVGPKRTSSQNTMFLIDQLVEILMRALSPGVTDPITAVSCLDWLQAALAIAVTRPEPEAFRHDERGNLRVVVHGASFQRISSAVFQQPLQYVAADRTAALRSMQVIAELLVLSIDDERRGILLQHAAMLNDAGGELLPLQSDRHELQERYRQTVHLADNPAHRRVMRDSQGWFGGRG